MDTTTPKLNNLAPITGRMVNEEDEVHNVVDPYGSLKVLDRSSSSVHEGVAFAHTETAALAAGASAYFMGVTGDITAHLWNFAIRADAAPLKVKFLEAITTSADGTQKTVVNRNRQSVIAPTMVVFAGPTVTNDGTLLAEIDILGNQQTVTENDFVGEWLLKKNTKYAFKITNNSAQVANLSAGFN